MLELEKTYLLKYLPERLNDAESEEITDIYIPADAQRPTLRIRKRGEKFRITKKEPLKGTDSSEQTEQTIILTQFEYEALAKLSDKSSVRDRFYYDSPAGLAMIDIFKEKLSGLAWVDFEFTNKNEKNGFEMPDFCLADVTQEKFIAGGLVAGKSYSDLENDLKRFNYKKITI